MNFKRKMKRVARRAMWRGQIDRREFEHVQKALKDEKVVAEWQAKIEAEPDCPWKVKQGRVDWTAVWEWLKKNWPMILKTLLSILPLLLLDAKSEKPEKE